LWQFWDLSVIRPMLDQYEAAHPGLRVEAKQLNWKNGLEEIQAALVSGDPPDVCELGSSWLARFADGGVLEDLTNEYEAIADSFLMWDSARWNGRVYGLPWVHGPRVLFYNRALFVRAGLAPDEPPRTWDELLHAARAVDGLGDDVDGFGLNFGERYGPYKNFLAFAWGNGGRVLEPGAGVTVESAENLAALEYCTRLAGYSYRDRQETLDGRFMAGRLGMQISGAWNLRRIREEAPDLDYGVILVPKPAADRGEHASFAGSELLVVFRGSRRTAESIQLARFLQGHARARLLALADGGVFPASRRVFADTVFTNDAGMNVFLRQSLTSRAAPAHPAWTEMEDVLNRAVEEALAGQRAPRWCLRSAAEELREIAARFE
jgi:multiple sugar transport system substrate-binding protein